MGRGPEYTPRHGMPEKENPITPYAYLKDALAKEKADSSLFTRIVNLAELEIASNTYIILLKQTIKLQSGKESEGDNPIYEALKEANRNYKKCKLKLPRRKDVIQRKASQIFYEYIDLYAKSFSQGQTDLTPYEINEMGALEIQTELAKIKEEKTKGNFS